MVNPPQDNAYPSLISANYTGWPRTNIFRDNVKRRGFIKKVLGIICV